MRKGCVRLLVEAVGFPVVMLVLLGAATAAAQPTASAEEQGSSATLKTAIERAWTVVRLQDGVLLVPRRGETGIGGVELRGSRIAIDGTTVSRAELRERLGADADAVLQVLELTESERLAALGVEDERAVMTVRRDVPQDDWSASRRRHSGARVRIGGDVLVAEGDHAGDAAVAILGSLTVNGEVDGDAVAVLGDLRLGPSAVVRGNAVAVGGRLERAAGARVYGEVTEVSIGFPEIRVGLPDVPAVHVDFRPGRWLAGLAFAGTTVRMLTFGVLAFVMLLLVPGAVQRVQRQVVEAPLRAGTVGLVAMVLLFPALVALCLVLIVSIIGIPLLALVPVLLVLGVVVWTVGVVAVATALGARLLGGQGDEAAPRFGALALGLALVWGLTVVARLAWWTSGDLSWPVLLLAGLGVGVELLVAAVALGALLLAWSQRRQVPPVPTATAVVESPAQ